MDPALPDRLILRFEQLNPFVRCAGSIRGLIQRNSRSAYDQRLIYITEGDGSIDVGPEKFKTKKYDCILICPGITYKVESGNNQRMIVINFDLTQDNAAKENPVMSDCIFNYIGHDIIDRYCLPGAHNEKGYIFLSDMIELSEVLEELLKSFRNKRIYSPIFLSGSCKSVLAKILDADNQKKAGTAPTRKKFDTIAAYIHANYKDDISNTRIASDLNYHPSYLNRIVLINTGVTLHKFLLDYRLSRAIQLLVQTDMPVYLVASECGIPNVKHFSYCFKKLFGMPPSKARSSSI